MKLKDGIAVFCENKEQATEFLNKCVESKFKWSSGDFIYPLKDVDSGFYEFGMYYFINDNILTRGNCRSNRRDYTYVSFKDLFGEDNMKLKEGMVVNCKNKDDARIFLDECKKQGFDDPYYYEYTDWEDFKEDTCYKIYNKNRIRYASKSFYISEGHKIINFKDLFKTESKFKVGDKVRVRNDLVEYKLYGSFRFIDKMIKYKNKVAKIINIENNYMCLDLDDGEWCWSEEMLEEVREDKMSKCKVYEMPDYVRDEIKKVIINNRTVVVILKSGHKGVATCSPQDKFIESVGYQIALMRARINKNEDNLKERKETLNRIIENPDSIANFPIV